MLQKIQKFCSGIELFLVSILKTCSKKIRYLDQFLIICRIRVSIRRIDAMTKVLIKSEWWNFSVHYINLNDVQFYPLYTRTQSSAGWNGTRRFNIYTPSIHSKGVSGKIQPTFIQRINMKTTFIDVCFIVSIKENINKELMIQIEGRQIWYLCFTYQKMLTYFVLIIIFGLAIAK